MPRKSRPDRVRDVQSYTQLLLTIPASGPITLTFFHLVDGNVIAFQEEPFSSTSVFQHLLPHGGVAAVIELKALTQAFASPVVVRVQSSKFTPEDFISEGWEVITHEGVHGSPRPGFVWFIPDAFIARFPPTKGGR